MVITLHFGDVCTAWMRNTHNALAHLIPGTSTTNDYVHLCKYVDEKCSAAMLAVNRSAGVAPEVKLRNRLHPRNEAWKCGTHWDFETQDRCPKHAYQWPVKEHVSTTEIKKNPSVLFIPFAQISFRQSSPLNWITLSHPPTPFFPISVHTNRPYSSQQTF